MNQSNLIPVAALGRTYSVLPNVRHPGRSSLLIVDEAHVDSLRADAARDPNAVVVVNLPDGGRLAAMVRDVLREMVAHSLRSHPHPTSGERVTVVTAWELPLDGFREVERPAPPMRTLGTV